MKHILLLQSKSICYQSTTFFMEQFELTLKALGYIVTRKAIQADVTTDLLLLAQNNYEAVIDFNSILPRLCDENNVAYIDYFNAPFYNYILDHPLYHHEILKLPRKNVHVICLDRAHKAYIKKHYTQIKGVHFFPLYAFMDVSNNSPLPFLQRPYDILFTGTYTPVAKISSLMETTNTDVRKEFLSMIEFRNEHLSLTMEECMQYYIDQLGVTLDSERFATFMHAYYPVDLYHSAYVRHMVISYLLSNGFKIAVAGHGWNQFEGLHNRNLTLLGEYSYENSLNLFSQAKISFNIMPGFTDGSHDRIFNSMIRKCAVCTDETPYLKEIFKHEESILFYNLSSVQKNTSTLFNTLTKYLTNPQTDGIPLEEIANAGYDITNSKFTLKEELRQLFD